MKRVPRSRMNAHVAEILLEGDAYRGHRLIMHVLACDARGTRM